MTLLPLHRWRRCALIGVVVLLFLLISGSLDPTGGVLSTYSTTEGASQPSRLIPSLFSGLMQTHNDVSPDVVNITDETDALNHLSVRKPAASLLRGKGAHSVKTTNVETCSDTIYAFDQQHQTVLDAHAAYLKGFTPPDAPPDVWSGRAPWCGVHALYNATGEVYRMPHITAEAAVGAPQRLVLERCSSGRVVPSELARYLRGAGEPASTCTDLYVAARLVGPSIVGAQVHREEGTCNIVVEYTLHDAGAYQLEVQVVWLNGLGPERSPPSHPLILRKVHSKFGKKPHQKYVFNEACEAQTHIHGSPLAITVVSATSPRPQSTLLPICRFGPDHLHGYGRWLRHRNDDLCNATTPYCSGNPSLLNDAKPFNEDYVWAPYRCRLHYYAYNDGPKGPCATRPGTMLLMGDSTTREYAQSLKLFNLRGTSLKVEYANWKLDWQYFSRPMAEKSVARLGQELRGTRPVILVANLGPLHLIGGLCSDDWRYYVDQWVKLFQPNGPLDFLEKKIFLGPAAIHYATNDMTAQRMLNWMAYAYQQLSPLGFEYVAAWNMTEARPEASWDGVHYSAERGKAQMKKLQRRRKVFKWNGGVSVMLTNLLLNMVCAPNY